MQTTAPSAVDPIVATQISDAADRLAPAMTSQYTSIWAVSDFLLDSAAALAGDPLAVAEVNQLHAKLAPSAQRTVALTTDVTAIVTAVRRIAGLS